MMTATAAEVRLAATSRATPWSLREGRATAEGSTAGSARIRGPMRATGATKWTKLPLPPRPVAEWRGHHHRLERCRCQVCSSQLRPLPLAQQPPASQPLLAQLMDMGFEGGRASAALARGSNLERALDLLTSSTTIDVLTTSPTAEDGERAREPADARRLLAGSGGLLCGGDRASERLIE